MNTKLWIAFRFVACLAVAAILIVTMVVATSAVTFSPLTDSIKIEEGRAVFSERCASCHSVNPNELSVRGPNLGTLLERKAHGNSSLTDYLLESILQPQASRSTEQYGYMPNVAKGLAKKDVYNLVGYLLHEIGEDDSYRELSFRYKSIAVEGPRTAAGNVHADYQTLEKGREIFFGKGNCATCHDWLAWEGAVREQLISKGPNLRNIGSMPKEHLRESILNPNKTILGGYESTVVLLEDGTTITGRILKEDESVYLLDTSSTASGAKVHVVEKSEIAQRKTSKVSSMPTYKELLSEEELEALIAFISCL